MHKFSQTCLASVALVVLFVGDSFSHSIMDRIVNTSSLEHDPTAEQTNKSEACRETVTINGRNIYHAEKQAFFVNAFQNTVFRGPRGYCVTTLGRNDYVVRPGIGAHKLLKHKVTWNAARVICMRDGGQLAVIDSAEKEAVFRSWMTQETVDAVWLGVHDLFDEGSWVTLSGEPLAEMSYYPWAKDEPNNWNTQNCGILSSKMATKGISDTSCDNKESFICEISLCDFDPDLTFPRTHMDKL